ncbi:glycerate kinase [Acidobacteriota bacterium]
MKQNLRADALDIFQAALHSVDSFSAVRKYFSLNKEILEVNRLAYPLENYENIYVLGTGKATAAMAKAVEEVLSKRITSGFINVKYGHSLPLKYITIKEAGHPVPDAAGLQGSEKIIRILQSAGEKDLIIFIISGGGSALLPSPVPGLSLEDIQETTQILLEVGANIDEMNILRKHLSRLKGGRLAKLAYPATLISLILSDVVGDHLGSIASGPTAPDESFYSSCIQIIDKFDIRKKIPKQVLEYFVSGQNGHEEETLKPGDPVFNRVQNVIIGSNIQAVKEAKRRAEILGYNSFILSSSIEGEAKDAAKTHASLAKEIFCTKNPLSPPACVISGGETTVTIRGTGTGGRNQEFALAAAIEIDGLDNTVILSCGTDGTDGPTDAAGAIVDGQTLNRARQKKMDADKYLLENNSYPFFKALDDLIFTGPTFTNVMDLRLILVTEKTKMGGSFE